MLYCPLTRTIQHRRHARPPDPTKTLYRLVTTLAARLGWYRLERLLSAIPDSNDDFMIF
ncbi:hypothetical protein [Paraburkholderia caribensis]|uniref:hypothetical protein n=1 Tax=Paraburkholderia caribensis TaxID=75105 RepID=UPI001CB51D01|nr:hypothetical protein [Paraburkholderia caribensis]CAG9258862.1 conserved hypothetical protein [Paraburkholderia caribensis]